MIAHAQLTITDLNDPILAGAAPENPVDGMLWLDTSVEPNMLKRYDESERAWINAGLDKEYVDDKVDNVDGKVDNVITTVTTHTTSIGQISGQINILVSRTTENEITTAGLQNRMEAAELKMEPESIQATVVRENESVIDTSKKFSTIGMLNDSITLAVGQINVGARNYLFDSEDLGYGEYIEETEFSRKVGSAIVGLSFTGNGVTT